VRLAGNLTPDFRPTVLSSDGDLDGSNSPIVMCSVVTWISGRVVICPRLTNPDLPCTYTSAELNSNNRMTARQEAMAVIVAAGIVAITFIIGFKSSAARTAGIQLHVNEMTKYPRPSWMSNLHKSVLAECFKNRATAVKTRMTKSKPIVKKNVEFNSDGLAAVTMQALASSLHSASTLNIPRYNSAQWATQRMPSGMTTDSLRFQSAIVRSIRDVEAQRIDMFPVQELNVKSALQSTRVVIERPARRPINATNIQ